MVGIDLVTLLLRNPNRFETRYTHHIDPGSNHEIQMEMIFERLKKLVPEQEKLRSNSSGSRMSGSLKRRLELNYSSGISLLSAGYDEQRPGEIVVKTPLFVEGLVRQEIDCMYYAGI